MCCVFKGKCHQALSLTYAQDVLQVLLHHSLTKPAVQLTRYNHGSGYEGSVAWRISEGVFLSIETALL